jgi:hypothetical protein
MGMKIIRRIIAVLFPMMLILSAFVILKQDILPACGIQLTVNTTGTSMEPTIKEGCLAICDENVPFEDIQVEDIICFRERSSIMSGSASTVVTFTLVPTDSSDSAPVDASSTEKEVDISSSEGISTDVGEEFKDTDIRYTEHSKLKEKNQALSYTDSYPILHPGSEEMSDHR